MTKLTVSNLKSHVELKKKIDSFFLTAKNNRCSEIPKDRSFRVRAINSQIFRIDENTQIAQEELVTKCVALLGSKTGNEIEIENLAWKVITEVFEDKDIAKDREIFYEKILESLVQKSETTFGFIAPNYSIQLQQDVQYLRVGPIEVFLSKDLGKIVFGDKLGNKLKVSIGEEYALAYYGGIVKIQLPLVSWLVKVRSAEGNLEEEAVWLINIMLSLLRISFPYEQYSSFPSTGELEPNPLTKPYTSDQGIRLSINSTYFGGFTNPKYYCIDKKVVAITEEDEFRKNANIIFNPRKDSDLSRRFAQGLGWLSRGRQTSDRAERFLFFFTAIEALLGSNDKSAPVIQTIARHASVVLKDDPKERIRIFKRIRNLYTRRSSLVHEGSRNVSSSEANSVQIIAEELYRRVLNCYQLDQSFNLFQTSLSEASHGLKWPFESA